METSLLTPESNAICNALLVLPAKYIFEINWNEFTKIVLWKNNQQIYNSSKAIVKAILILNDATIDTHFMPNKNHHKPKFGTETLYKAPRLYRRMPSSQPSSSEPSPQSNSPSHTNFLGTQKCLDRLLERQ